MIKIKMNKRALLGFVIVLVLTLTLAGLTFYKVAEIFGLHQTQKALDSFYKFVQKVNDTSAKPVGTKESMPLYMDEKSAILGFSKASQEIAIRTGINHYNPRPRECYVGACICLCRDYDWKLKVSSWHYYPTLEVLPIRCREEFICYNFTNFDFPTEMSKTDIGLDFGIEGGFMIARNFMLGDQKIESRLSGIYITKESGDLMSVSYNIEGISKDTLKGYENAKKAEALFQEAHDAYAKQDWNTAITKYEESINNKLVDKLMEGHKEETYWFRGLAYYKKGDREKAVIALEEAVSNIEDENARKAIQKKIEEIEGGK